ncbi:iron-containing alcohol dehydrogenase family RfbM domain protein [Vibrio cholerae HC-47A1]|nr:iron-containing alcohol dehydrogenase family RfbM domain protein [Vibrio cholerae HC-61A1]EJH48834.1 iron-containing alcohol dehydrogenase family RfbM domain protein [Vibrio cholerae CP1048(21)]EJH85828.1 iron-containing alcohol dehydrogenase family RfbM domain protein [Vibrio cholerae HC-47A1]EKL01099.1 hypothetical protein VCCP1035_0270 [Vibrio cholerae CP1035(8)]ELT27439.1 iron-containing alcohol dehydrogenase family RfbM domain protein [Vibrio cholerae HC-7A1]
MELSSLGYSTNAQLLNQNFYIDHLHCHPFVVAQNLLQYQQR